MVFCQANVSHAIDGMNPLEILRVVFFVVCHHLLFLVQHMRKKIRNIFHICFFQKYGWSVAFFCVVRKLEVNMADTLHYRFVCFNRVILADNDRASKRWFIGFITAVLHTARPKCSHAVQVFQIRPVKFSGVWAVFVCVTFWKYHWQVAYLAENSGARCCCRFVGIKAFVFIAAYQLPQELNECWFTGTRISNDFKKWPCFFQRWFHLVREQASDPECQGNNSLRPVSFN